MIFQKHKMSRQGLQDRTERLCKKYAEHCKQPVNVVFDIGANVGIYAAFFAKHFPDAQIYSFEPVASNFKMLVDNIKLNSLSSRVSPHNFGFWSSSQSISMGYPSGREKKNTGLFSVFGKKWFERCEVKNMDEWAESNEVYPDLIKIDTEGSECIIIESSPQCLDRVKYVVWENNPYYADKNQGLSSLLSENGLVKVESASWKMDEFWERTQ